MKYPKVPKDILPTLVIGLGGTGYQIVKRLKQLFKKRYNTENLPIRYLLVDTDLKSFLDDSVKNNEKCQLRFGEGIKNTLDWAYKNPNFDWLPQNPKITPDFFTSTDQGAGLVRPIGRMYLCKNAKLVYDNLQTAKNDLVDLHKVLTDLGENYLENIDRHKVYICGSLAGGTGCGTFLDVAVMVSKIFNRDNTNIIGMFTLESCYDDKLSSDLDAQNRSKANCYAALKELEFYMSSVTNFDDKKYTFKYSNIGEIKLDRKLLDICYLIENKNEMGGVLTNIEDIYDLCSLQLFQEIGTTLGSQLRADYANFICKDKDPVLKKDRHFSTFSSSSMEFPAENLINYCTYRFAEDLLEKLGKEFEKDEELFDKEAGELINGINSRLNIAQVCSDFAKSHKLSSETFFNDLMENKMDELDLVENTSKDREKKWIEAKAKYGDSIEELLKNYVNEATVNHGVTYVIEVLNVLKAKLYKEASDVRLNPSSKSTVEAETNILNTDKKKYKKVLKSQESIPNEIVKAFNAFTDYCFLKLKKKVYEDRCTLVEENIKIINEELKILIGRTSAMKKEIETLIKKINNQSQKKYGGNIISREIINKDFYENYYKKQILKDFESITALVFKDFNLIKVIEKGLKELVSCCRTQFEEPISKEDIIKILEMNFKNELEGKTEVESKSKKFKDYVKRELDVTAKLAKPFWSAIKNPEVSWTECYYIGCMKGESNNGFTIKAPEAIDEWIRNQTGERSRWARYVETTNPYSIDIIHITMGACAAYLPDIRNYKQFYLKLLSSKTYPLHLSEEYVGLEELDKEFDDILLTYSLAKAYGAIIEEENISYLNIKQQDDEFVYIYPSKFCLFKEGDAVDKAEEIKTENISINFAPSRYYRIVNEAIPENKSCIPGELRLGDSYHETIRRISENYEINALIDRFLEDARNKFGREKLKEHCINQYIKEKVSGDFIARNKVINEIECI